MNKCHTPIVWHNDTTPAINETNLNYEDGCIDTIDDRVVAMDTSKANQSDLLKAFKDVSLNTTTGVITFTLFDNTTKTIDTLLEKVAINFDYDDNPASAHYQNLIIELEDGTYKYIDMSALITEYEFTTSDTIAFTVGQDGAVSASVRDGSITGAKLQPNYLADVTAQATAASDAATASNANQLLSEGYANGTQGGVPVSSSSPYYHNNAKYWKEQAQAIAGGSLSGLSDVSITNPQDGDCLVYDSANAEWKNGMPVQDNTVTGNPLSFTTQSAGVSSHTVITLEPKQAGSGDPSPSNVRAISGYDSVDISVSGKNLWSQGNVSGTRIKGVNSFLPKGTYTISALVTSSDTDASTSTFKIYDKTYTVNLFQYSFTRNSRASASFTISEDGYHFDFSASDTSTHGIGDTFTFSDIQIEVGSSATAYEPYNAITALSISTPNTIYGGTLDVETGVLTVDRGVQVYNGSETWTYHASGIVKIANPSGIDVSSEKHISNMYLRGNAADNLCFSVGSSVLYVHDNTNATSAANFQTFLSSHNLIVVYDLATPVTYQLTPYQVSLLSGANVVTTNGTTIQLTYRQGTIASQTDLVSIAGSVNNLADMVNDTNGVKANKTDLTSIIATGSTNTTGAQINSGSYFYLNGVFCKALSNIASNASFTKNTNYKETTIAAELIELFNS